MSEPKEGRGSVVYGPCACGGYGICYDAPTAAELGKCHESLEDAREQRRGEFVSGLEAIIFERHRQIAVEGYGEAHDATHQSGELALAAACYASAAWELINGVSPEKLDRPNYWPWSSEHWKPTSVERCLEKAGALIAAEWDRLNREGA